MPSWPLPKVGSSLNAARPQNVLYDDEVAGLVATTMPFCALAATTLPSGIGPPITVRVGRAFDDHAVERVADGGVVVGAHAEEVGLDRRVVGVGDAQAVAAVAADHVVEHERILLERAADQRVAVGVLDGHAVEACCRARRCPRRSVPMKLPLSWFCVDLPLMSTPLALLPEIRLPCGGRTNTPAVGSLPPVASPPIRLRAEPSVTRMPLLGVAQIERAGDVGADVVHGDLVVVRPVEPDAVAAVAADHVRQLEAGVDRRLVTRTCRRADRRCRPPDCRTPSWSW